MTVKTVGSTRTHVNTGVKFQGQFVYATALGVKVGSKGKVVSPSAAVYGQMPKGEARRLRKALLAKGKPYLASLPRITYANHDAS